MNALSRRRLLQAGASAALPLPALAADSPRPAAPPFRLGLVTYNVARAWDLDTILKVCKTVGLAAAELRTTHSHGVEPSLSPDKRKEVKARFADSGVQFWGCGSVCEFQAVDPAVVKKNIEECKAFVQLVADLGGRSACPHAVPRGAAHRIRIDVGADDLEPFGDHVACHLQAHGAEADHAGACDSSFRHGFPLFRRCAVAAALIEKPSSDSITTTP